MNGAPGPDVAGQLIHDIAELAAEHGAFDLALGAPDFEPPAELKAALIEAVDRVSHQYTRTAGSAELCTAIAERLRERFGVAVDPETEVTVTCGVTEATTAALLGLARPGAEVILFEPYFVNYLPSILAAGMIPRFVRLHPPDWELDPAELARAFGPRTRLILINTPNNPSGKVFSAAELAAIGELCERWDALCLADEIYECLVFDGRDHCSVLSLPGLRERAVVMGGLSKTYSVTGWRIGYAIAPAELGVALRNAHEFLTCCAPGVLQAAAAAALRFPAAYYDRLRGEIQARRDRLVPALAAAGFGCLRCEGGYFLMADIRRFGFADDRQFVTHLIREVGVAAVPGSAFYVEPAAGADLVRFCFGKARSTIEGAVERLCRLRPAPAGGAPQEV